MDKNLKQNSGSIVAGLFILGLGVLFLLDNINVLDSGSIISNYWPTILIILGLVQLVTRSSSIFGSIFLILAGILFQLNTLDILPWNLWGMLWPVILILAGANIIYSHFRTKQIPADSSDAINSSVFMAGNKVRNTSTSFQGGNINIMFGGTELDLTDAKFEGSATIVASVFAGGLEIRVPQDWKVEISGMPLLGGWDNKTNAHPESTKVLKIKATVVCGGIEVRN